jgi:hypothetical protein
MGDLHARSSPVAVSSPEWDSRDESALAKRLGGGGGEKGRVLQAVGWHDFDWNASVGALLLHVDPSKPLLVKRVLVADGLTGGEEQEVRSALLTCAIEVAVEMKSKGVGNGCVDWDVPADQAGRILRLYPDFEVAPKREQPRGKRSLLRRCPGQQEEKS